MATDDGDRWCDDRTQTGLCLVTFRPEQLCRGVLGRAEVVVRLDADGGPTLWRRGRTAARRSQPGERVTSHVRHWHNYWRTTTSRAGCAICSGVCNSRTPCTRLSASWAWPESLTTSTILPRTSRPRSSRTCAGEAPAVGLALGITAAAAPSERTGDCAGEPTAAELVVGMPEFYLARGRVDRGGGRRRAVGVAGDPGATEHGVARRGFGGCVGGVPNGTNGLVPGDGRAESAPNRNCPHRVPASRVRVLRRLTACPRQRRMMDHAYLEQRTRPPWQHALRRCRERQGRARRSSREAERRRVAHAGGPSNQEDVT